MWWVLWESFWFDFGSDGVVRLVVLGFGDGGDVFFLICGDCGDWGERSLGMMVGLWNGSVC